MNIAPLGAMSENGRNSAVPDSRIWMHHRKEHRKQYDSVVYQADLPEAQALKVLVIEHDLIDRMVTMRACRRSRVVQEAVALRDGTDAMDYLQHTGGGAPDVIILDLELPEGGGQQVLQWLTTAGDLAQVPVFVVFRDLDEHLVTSCLAGGAKGYIRKTPDVLEYSDTMCQFFDSLRPSQRDYMTTLYSESTGRGA